MKKIKLILLIMALQPFVQCVSRAMCARNATDFEDVDKRPDYPWKLMTILPNEGISLQYLSHKKELKLVFLNSFSSISVVIYKNGNCIYNCEDVEMSMLDNVVLYDLDDGHYEVIVYEVNRCIFKEELMIHNNNK